MELVKRKNKIYYATNTAQISVLLGSDRYHLCACIVEYIDLARAESEAPVSILMIKAIKLK